MHKELIKFITHEFHGGQSATPINTDTDLLDGGHIDSMGMMRLIQHVEETFAIKISPQDMTIDNFISVQAIVNFVEKTKSDTP